MSGFADIMKFQFHKVRLKAVATDDFAPLLFNALTGRNNGAKLQKSRQSAII